MKIFFTFFFQIHGRLNWKVCVWKSISCKKREHSMNLWQRWKSCKGRKFGQWISLSVCVGNYVSVALKYPEDNESICLTIGTSSTMKSFQHLGKCLLVKMSQCFGFSGTWHHKTSWKNFKKCVFQYARNSEGKGCVRLTTDVAVSEIFFFCHVISFLFVRWYVLISHIDMQNYLSCISKV